MLSVEKQILYLISSTRDIDVKTLVDIYEARDVSPQIIRNTLSRLKKDGYIESTERSRYAVTPLGSEFIQTINRKPLLIEQQWDGVWHMVMFEVPEADRKKRDAFRGGLLQLGFGLLYKSVYISPWDYTEDVLLLADNLGITDWVTLGKGSFVHNGITPEKAGEIWSLNSLNEVYLTKQEWIHSRFSPSLESLLKEKPVDDRALFVRFLELGEIIAELGLSDPILPEELLPEGWIGRSCFLEYQRLLRTIAGAIPEESAYRVFVNRFTAS
ncbi:PaaX family transcriptional regulator C-terminal domain-containing protein [Paenibacillus zeisoli]|nr:PaaX family transcriptional regulator C-terminal domain-containing protein [Paenibacillus zeisoli]